MHKLAAVSIPLIAVLAFGASAAQAAVQKNCDGLNLSPTARTDCESAMENAQTDNDRVKIIRDFAMGLAAGKAEEAVRAAAASSSAPAQTTAQTSPQAANTQPETHPASPPTTPAAVSGSHITNATGPDTPAAMQATPQQRATAASGGPQTGTKHAAQKTATKASSVKKKKASD